MGTVVSIEVARQRRHARALTCEQCMEPRYEGGLCAWHFAMVTVAAAELRDRMAAEQAAGERCCAEACRQPIKQRQVRVVLADRRALHVRCALELIEQEAAMATEGA